MAAIHNPSVSFLSVFLPVARASLQQPARTHPLLQQLQRRANNALNNSILPAVFLPIPTLLGGLWDGLLKAVPKKKTSHMKKRHRQMAGKALKDVTALNTCSSCGRQKRAHVLCEYCVNSIKRWFTNGFRTPEETERLNKPEDLEIEEDRDDDLSHLGDKNSARNSGRGTSNETKWYQSQERYLPSGQRAPQTLGERWGLLRRKSTPSRRRGSDSSPKSTAAHETTSIDAISEAKAAASQQRDVSRPSAQ